ncbi:hypothetical protein [Streptomyces sp. NPDC101776]|uniref:hypothetical protein n=1 Tax=Streptomyces sp. NPDC101776 TaxID=3366146 RepID=UPI00381F072E
MGRDDLHDLAGEGGAAVADQVKPLAKKKLWTVVSQDDDKSYSGENAITKVIKAQKAPVNYAAFKAGTVVPKGSTTSAHMATWPVACTIPGIRDRVMNQNFRRR